MRIVDQGRCFGKHGALGRGVKLDNASAGVVCGEPEGEPEADCNESAAAESEAREKHEKGIRELCSLACHRVFRSIVTAGLATLYFQVLSAMPNVYGDLSTITRCATWYHTTFQAI